MSNSSNVLNTSIMTQNSYVAKKNISAADENADDVERSREQSVTGGDEVNVGTWSISPEQKK